MSRASLDEGITEPHRPLMCRRIVTVLTWQRSTSRQIDSATGAGLFGSAPLRPIQSD